MRVFAEGGIRKPPPPLAVVVGDEPLQPLQQQQQRFDSSSNSAAVAAAFALSSGAGGGGGGGGGCEDVGLSSGVGRPVGANSAGSVSSQLVSPGATNTRTKGTVRNHTITRFVAFSVCRYTFLQLLCIKTKVKMHQPYINMYCN